MPDDLMGVESTEKFHQLDTSKLPLEGARLAVREFLVEDTTWRVSRETFPDRE
jgi:hypothetical protein